MIVGRRAVERGVGGQDPGLQVRQVRGRFDAQLVEKQRAGVVKGPQGLVQPAGAVLGQHAQSPQPLAQRAGRDLRPQFDQRPLRVADCEQALQEPLTDLRVQLVQPGDGRRHPWLVRQRRVRAPPPQRGCLRRGRDRRSGWPAASNARVRSASVSNRRESIRSAGTCQGSPPPCATSTGSPVSVVPSIDRRRDRCDVTVEADRRLWSPQIASAIASVLAGSPARTSSRVNTAASAPPTGRSLARPLEEQRPEITDSQCGLVRGVHRHHYSPADPTGPVVGTPVNCRSESRATCSR